TAEAVTGKAVEDYITIDSINHKWVERGVQLNATETELCNAIKSLEVVGANNPASEYIIRTFVYKDSTIGSRIIITDGAENNIFFQNLHNLSGSEVIKLGETGTDRGQVIMQVDYGALPTGFFYSGGTKIKVDKSKIIPYNSTNKFKWMKNDVSLNANELAVCKAIMSVEVVGANNPPEDYTLRVFTYKDSQYNTSLQIRDGAENIIIPNTSLTPSAGITKVEFGAINTDTGLIRMLINYDRLSTTGTLINGGRKIIFDETVFKDSPDTGDSNPLKGKSIAILGDSIMMNFSTQFADHDTQDWNSLKNKLLVNELINCGIGGARWQDRGDTNITDSPERASPTA